MYPEGGTSPQLLLLLSFRLAGIPPAHTSTLPRTSRVGTPDIGGTMTTVKARQERLGKGPLIPVAVLMREALVYGFVARCVVIIVCCLNTERIAVQESLHLWFTPAMLRQGNSNSFPQERRWGALFRRLV